MHTSVEHKMETSVHFLQVAFLLKVNRYAFVDMHVLSSEVMVTGCILHLQNIVVAVLFVFLYNLLRINFFKKKKRLCAYEEIILFDIAALIKYNK